MRSNLSEMQKHAVEYDDGSLSVVAGAGSGKTRVLTERIKYIVRKLKDGERVLAITFSIKAANELTERLEKELGADVLNEYVTVGTTHNFCLNVIMERGRYIGLPENLHVFELESDRMKLFMQALSSIKYWRDKYSPFDQNQKEIQNLFYLISKRKRELKFSYDYESQPYSEMLFKEYDEILLSNNSIDFDDILRYAYKIFNDFPKIREIYSRVYKHICVDEAQDLNKAQYETIKLLSNYGDIPVTMVGDPRQAIYGFNGSSYKYFKENFPQEFKSVKKIELKENFRSSKQIVSAAQELDDTYFANCETPMEGEVEINEFFNETEEAQWIADKIQEIHVNGHAEIEGETVDYQSMCVIARNRYIFNELEKVLGEREIPYNLLSSLSEREGYETNFFRLLYLTLRVIVNENDSLHLREMNEIIYKKRGVIKTINQIIQDNDKSEYIVFLSDIIDDIKKGVDNDIEFDAILTKLERYINLKEVKGDLYDYNMLLEDYISLKEKWNKFIKSSVLGKRNLSNFLRAIALGMPVDSQINGVALSTVHMTKGLEFDLVFIMGVNEGVFPDYRAQEKEDREEEKHNMFVAITRAKRVCYISYPCNKENRLGKQYAVSASMFIGILKKKA